MFIIFNGIKYKIAWRTRFSKKLPPSLKLWRTSRQGKEKYRRLKRKSGASGYAEYKNIAREIVTTRIEHFNGFYKFNINRISIKNQKTRWGSCSKKGNLNFNYRLALLPPHLSDYIIVHELCHLGELNHSPKFWKLVIKTIPNHKIIKREFRKIRLL